MGFPLLGIAPQHSPLVSCMRQKSQEQGRADELSTEGPSWSMRHVPCSQTRADEHTTVTQTRASTVCLKKVILTEIYQIGMYLM